LIYLPSSASKDRQWFYAFECDWNTGSSRPQEQYRLGFLYNICDPSNPNDSVHAEKCNPAALYSHLEELFVNVIGIASRSFTSLLGQLVAIRNTKTAITTNRAKVILESVNELILSLQSGRISNADDLLSVANVSESLSERRLNELAAELRACPIFPVVMRNNEEKCLSVAESFVIPDDGIYPYLFHKKLDILDLDLVGVRRLGPLLELAGLTDRYMTRCPKVTQLASDESTCKTDLQFTDKIRQRAQILTM